jgi:hypothetical protein
VGLVEPIELWWAGDCTLMRCPYDYVVLVVKFLGVRMSYSAVLFMFTYDGWIYRTLYHSMHCVFIHKLCFCTYNARTVCVVCNCVLLLLALCVSRSCAFLFRTVVYENFEAC